MTGLASAAQDNVGASRLAPGVAGPLVGIGMPVYNGARYVAEAIESIRGQTYAAFELLICDNASTDETAAICRRFAAADSRIRYVRNDTNIGAHPNYNRTFELTRGKYFKWAPHDDVLHPEYLAECVKSLEGDSGAVVCQSQLDYIDGQGEELGIVSTALPGTDSESAATRFAAAVLRPHNCYAVMGLFRRDALAGSMLLESFHGADRALVAQLAVRGRFLGVSRPLLRVRDHDERYTRAKVRPEDRAVWHDSRLKGRKTFPMWRLYRSYWSMAWREKATAGERMRMSSQLLQWWFVNWNAARVAVGTLATVFPPLTGWAERLKQRVFSPAPGIDEVRKPR